MKSSMQSMHNRKGHPLTYRMSECGSFCLLFSQHSALVICASNVACNIAVSAQQRMPFSSHSHTCMTACMQASVLLGAPGREMFVFPDVLCIHCEAALSPIMVLAMPSCLAFSLLYTTSTSIMSQVWLMYIPVRHFHYQPSGNRTSIQRTLHI